MYTPNLLHTQNPSTHPLSAWPSRLCRLEGIKKYILVGSSSNTPPHVLLFYKGL